MAALRCYNRLAGWRAAATQRGTRTVTKPEKRKAAHIKVETYWAICNKCRELIVKVHKTVAYAGKVSASPEHLAKGPQEESTWLRYPSESQYQP
jgi:hypothetical protein